LVDNLICTVCPVACNMTIEGQRKDNYIVSGNKCDKGKSYAIQEIKNPVRIFTSTINITGGSIKRLPIRSKEPVPKNIIREIITPIREIKVKAPIKKGDVIIKNILGSGIDIVASRSVD